MAEVQTSDKPVQRVYYYYPAYGKKYARRVLAGVVSGNKLFVGESVCFTGNGSIEPDQFVKRRGREIAEGRAWKAANGVDCEECAAFVATIPANTIAVGKFFVEQVEAQGYPKHTSKPKKVKGEPAPMQA